MSRGGVSPLLLWVFVIAVAAILLAGVYKRVRCPLVCPAEKPPAGVCDMPAPCCPSSAVAPVAVAPPVPPAAPMSSTAAVAAASAVEVPAAERRRSELDESIAATYRKLAELRRAVQATPEVRQLQAAIEADRRALDEKLSADSGIQALTARRKALLAELTALQTRQTDLARRLRANPADAALKAEGQAALAKLRETSAELGAVGRQLEDAKTAYTGQNAEVAALASRLAKAEESVRSALADNADIRSVEQELETLAAEKRRLDMEKNTP
jgi:chromosome segregation ATPase